jgi:hypothetical protein
MTNSQTPTTIASVVMAPAAVMKTPVKMLGL